MRKMFAVVGMLVAASVSLVGCSVEASANGAPDDGGVTRYAVTMQDNTKVDCLYLSGVKEAALECLWNTASVETETTKDLKSVVVEGNIPCVIHDGVKEAAMSCDI